MGDQTGKIKEEVGWATGDRQVDAEGRVEQKAADPSQRQTDVTHEAMEDARQAVRKDHHAIDPEGTEEVDADEKS